MRIIKLEDKLGNYGNNTEVMETLVRGEIDRLIAKQAARIFAKALRQKLKRKLRSPGAHISAQQQSRIKKYSQCIRPVPEKDRDRAIKQRVSIRRNVVVQRKMHQHGNVHGCYPKANCVQHISRLIVGGVHNAACQINRRWLVLHPSSRWTGEGW